MHCSCQPLYVFLPGLLTVALVACKPAPTDRAAPTADSVSPSLEALTRQALERASMDQEVLAGYLVLRHPIAIAFLPLPTGRYGGARHHMSPDSVTHLTFLIDSLMTIADGAGFELVAFDRLDVGARLQIGDESRDILYDLPLPRSPTALLLARPGQKPEVWQGKASVMALQGHLKTYFQHRPWHSPDRARSAA